MKVLITGATGFIGSAIIHDFHNKHYGISILTRNKKQLQQDFLTIYENIDDIPANSKFDIIINLAGAPISKRWSNSYKKTLIASRVQTTRDIYHLVERLETKPTKLISASAIGYYGRQGDIEITEDSTATDEFTHQLCLAWEQAALQLQELGLQVIIMRLGVVLGPGGGILKKTTPAFKIGLGGKIGSGQQYLSWVHIDDVVSAINFLAAADSASGAYNITAPYPINNNTWTKTLAKVLGRPAWLDMPSIAVKILFGEMGDALLLHGQKVLPKKLLAAGFKFKYQRLADALASIFLR